MKNFIFLCLLMLSVFSCSTGNEKNKEWALATPDGSPVRSADVDTMDIKNPFVVYDRRSDSYYMVGDGGYMWTSDDMKLWNGPYNVVCVDNDSWPGNVDTVVAPEIAEYKGKYYYTASFVGDTISCIALVADSITGPYRVIDTEYYPLDLDDVAYTPTICTDEQNLGYMIYANNTAKNNEPTLEIIRFGKDFSYRLGEPYAMLKASTVEWQGTARPSKLESPFLFVTETGLGGLLFTANMGDESVVGVAYTAMTMGHWLNGPWVVETEPLMRGNVGGASLFTDYDGTLVMTVHKDTVINGVKKFVPQFVKMDSQFDKLKKIGYYNF